MTEMELFVSSIDEMIHFKKIPPSVDADAVEEVISMLNSKPIDDPDWADVINRLGEKDCEIEPEKALTAVTWVIRMHRFWRERK